MSRWRVPAVFAFDFGAAPEGGVGSEPNAEIVASFASNLASNPAMSSATNSAVDAPPATETAATPEPTRAGGEGGWADGTEGSVPEVSEPEGAAGAAAAEGARAAASLGGGSRERLEIGGLRAAGAVLSLPSVLVSYLPVPATGFEGEASSSLALAPLPSFASLLELDMSRNGV